MKVLTFNPGTGSFLVREIPIPEIGAHDVLVKVAACGLNRVDAKLSLWKNMVPVMGEFWTPGLDVSGGSRRWAMRCVAGTWEIAFSIMATCFALTAVLRNTRCRMLRR